MNENLASGLSVFNLLLGGSQNKDQESVLGEDCLHSQFLPQGPYWFRSSLASVASSGLKQSGFNSVMQHELPNDFQTAFNVTKKLDTRSRNMQPPIFLS